MPDFVADEYNEIAQRLREIEREKIKARQVAATDEPTAVHDECERCEGMGWRWATWVDRSAGTKRTGWGECKTCGNPRGLSCPTYTP